MRIGFCSYYDEAIASWAVPCAKSHEKYCHRNGYAYIRPERLFRPERRPHWQKPEILLRHLGQFDLMAWVDADCVITNFDFRIESLVAPYMQCDLHVNKDMHGFNNGVMIWRNTPAAFDMLLDWRDRGPIGKVNEDQIVLKGVMDDHQGRARIAWVEQKLMNAYCSHHEADDWLVHFAGQKNRAELTRRYCRLYCPEVLTDETSTAFFS